MTLVWPPQGPAPAASLSPSPRSLEGLGGSSTESPRRPVSQELAVCEAALGLGGSCPGVEVAVV